MEGELLLDEIAPVPGGSVKRGDDGSRRTSEEARHSEEVCLRTQYASTKIV